MPLSVENLIFIKLADKQDRHKIPDEFKTGPYCSILFGATCPKLLKKSLSGHAGSQVSEHCPLATCFYLRI